MTSSRLYLVDFPFYKQVSAVLLVWGYCDELPFYNTKNKQIAKINNRIAEVAAQFNIKEHELYDAVFKISFVGKNVKKFLDGQAALNRDSPPYDNVTQWIRGANWAEGVLHDI